MKNKIDWDEIWDDPVFRIVFTIALFVLILGLSFTCAVWPGRGPY